VLGLKKYRLKEILQIREKKEKEKKRGQRLDKGIWQELERNWGLGYIKDN